MPTRCKRRVLYATSRAGGAAGLFESLGVHRMEFRQKRPGGAFEPCGLPDPPGRVIIWPNRPKTARHRTTTWTLHPGTLRRDNACAFWQGKVLAGRKPLLLLRFAGPLLLRQDERTSDAFAQHEPMIAGKSTRVMAGPQDQIIGFRDDNQLLVSCHPPP